MTAGKESITLTGVGENTQVLRLGLLKGMNELRSWTPTQRDEIDGLAGQIITHKDVRPLRTEGQPVGCTGNSTLEKNGPPKRAVAISSGHTL